MIRSCIILVCHGPRSTSSALSLPSDLAQDPFFFKLSLSILLSDYTLSSSLDNIFPLLFTLYSLLVPLARAKDVGVSETQRLHTLHFIVSFSSRFMADDFHCYPSPISSRFLSSILFASAPCNVFPFHRFQSLIVYCIIIMHRYTYACDRARLFVEGCEAKGKKE